MTSIKVEEEEVTVPNYHQQQYDRDKLEEEDVPIKQELNLVTMKRTFSMKLNLIMLIKMAAF